MRILIHKELFRVSNELFMISLNLVNFQNEFEPQVKDSQKFVGYTQISGKA